MPRFDFSLAPHRRTGNMTIWSVTDWLMNSWSKRTSNKLLQSTSRRRRSMNFWTAAEVLDARIVLDATAVANAEHTAVFGTSDANGVVTGGLVPDSAVTVKSVANGNWSDPTIWSTGKVPHSLDNVLVTANTVVTVDGDESVFGALKTIRLDGKLNFNQHANTELLVDTLIVEDGAVLNIGSPINPNDPTSGPIDASHNANGRRSAVPGLSDTDSGSENGYAGADRRSNSGCHDGSIRG